MKSLLRWSQNILLLSAALLFSCLVGEIILRLLFPESVTLFPRYHTRVTYSDYTIRALKPNHTFWHSSIDGSWRFVTNNKGFRDKDDYTYDKPPEVQRILVLGDSNTLGFEVEQESTYSSVMEEFLNSHGVAVEVLNTGISGFGTAEQLVYLEHEGIRYNPNYVVLGFYANDLQDNVKAGLFTISDGSLVDGRKDHTPGVSILDTINSVASLRWMSENSYFYSVTMNTVWDAAKHILVTRRMDEIDAEYSNHRGAYDAHEAMLASRLLERLYLFCNTRGIKLIVVDIPQLKDGKTLTSVPPSMTQVVGVNSDYFLSSYDTVTSHNNDHAIFVPHGQRHISEYTHRILALAVSDIIRKEWTGQFDLQLARDN